MDSLILKYVGRIISNWIVLSFYYPRNLVEAQLKKILEELVDEVKKNEYNKEE